MGQNFILKPHFLGFLVKNRQIRNNLYEIFDGRKILLTKKMKFYSKWNSYYQIIVLLQIAQAAVRKK
jgi:hypothetical protein